MSRFHEAQWTELENACYLYFQLFRSALLQYCWLISQYSRMLLCCVIVYICVNVYISVCKPQRDGFSIGISFPNVQNTFWIWVKRRSFVLVLKPALIRSDHRWAVVKVEIRMVNDRTDDEYTKEHKDKVVFFSVLLGGRTLEHVLVEYVPHGWILLFWPLIVFIGGNWSVL